MSTFLRGGSAKRWSMSYFQSFVVIARRMSTTSLGANCSVHMWWMLGWSPLICPGRMIRMLEDVCEELEHQEVVEVPKVEERTPRLMYSGLR
ncbi:hypothetical protein Leryth_020786, partial [Lithospermum erythrorhizon]